nr:hypothetical protein [Tanacetum cinerariifolium]
MVGHVVPLLPVAPDRSSGELEASVDKLFDEGGSGEQAEQGHSASSEQGVGIQLKTIAVDDGEPSHPVNRLRDDHRVLGGTSTGGKSQLAVQRLLAGAVRNAEVRGEAIPSLRFVTSSVSATPERKGEGHIDSVTGPNLRAISTPQRFVISSNSSHHAGANIAEAEVDSFASITTSTVDPTVIVKEKFIKPSLFSIDSASAGGTDPAIGGFTDLNGSDLLVGFLLKEAEAAEAIRLRAESSKFETVEKSLQGEVEAFKERNNTLGKEKIELDVKVTDLVASVKVWDHEVADLDVVITSIRSQNDHLTSQCLNSHEYLSALSTAIGKAIEKGMQEGLAARIVHGKEGRVLTDVAAYNPSTEDDYIFALQQLQSVTFSLLTELKSYKDSSIEAVMDILHIDEPLVEKLNLNELHPNVDQLMVPIYHSPDKVVVGASALSPALGTFGTVSATADTTAALSITLTSASIITHISVDDYEATGTNDQAAANENVAGESTNSFPIVDDVGLVVPQ